MKYRIQLAQKMNGRNHWRGYEAFEKDTDCDAAVYAIEQTAKYDRPMRLLDATDSVIVSYAPNSAKF